MTAIKKVGSQTNFSILIIFLLVVVIVVLVKSLNVAQEYERAVVFRLGRLIGFKGPGLFMIIPFLQTLTEIAVEKNSNIIFPMPIDLVSVFAQLRQAENRDGQAETLK